MVGFLGGLIGALGGGQGIGSMLGGLGGLLGGGKSRAQGVDYLKLRQDAEKGGFNPLTALMSGGGQGYQREFTPALSSGAFIQDAVSRGVDTFFNTPPKDDPLAKSVRAANDYIAAKHEAQARALPRPFGYSLTDVQPFGVAAKGSSNVRGASGSADPVAVMVPTAGSDGIVRMGPNPNGPDADQALFALATDAYYRATNNTFGRPLTRAAGNYYPPHPSTDKIDPEAWKKTNPWYRTFVAPFSWPAEAPRFGSF